MRDAYFSFHVKERDSGLYEVRVRWDFHPRQYCSTKIVLFKIVTRLVDDRILARAPADMIHRCAEVKICWTHYLTAFTRPTSPLARRTLIPRGWVDEFVRISATIPSVCFPVCWSRFNTIETGDPGLISARLVPSTGSLLFFIPCSRRQLIHRSPRGRARWSLRQIMFSCRL